MSGVHIFIRSLHSYVKVMSSCSVASQHIQEFLCTFYDINEELKCEEDKNPSLCKLKVEDTVYRVQCLSSLGKNHDAKE